MRKIILIALVCIILLLTACSGGGKTGSATSSQQVQPEKVYSERSIPTSGTTEDELRSVEITPSGDPKCFLSPCDCNCYMIQNVPLDAKKPTCGINCKSQYGIKGCVFRGYSCSAVK